MEASRVISAAAAIGEVDNEVKVQPAPAFDDDPNTADTIVETLIS